MKKLIAILMMGTIAPAAFATSGTWTNVTVTHITPCAATSGAPCSVGTAYVQVTFSASSTGNPTCSGSAKTYGVIDVSTSAGAFLAAVMQSAFLSGSTISANGTGACSILTNEETLGEAVE